MRGEDPHIPVARAERVVDAKPERAGGIMRGMLRATEGPGGQRFRAATARPEAVVLLFAVLLVIVLGLLKPQFLSTLNIENIARQTSVLAIITVGIFFVLVVGGVDISVASQMAMVSIASALLAPSVGVEWAFTAGVGLGLAFGLVNGVLISVIKLSPIVVTIATSQILLGFALLKTTTGPISPDVSNYQALATEKVGFVPILVLIALATLIAGHFILTSTAFGRYVYAIGGNETAAWLAGIPVMTVKVGCYALCGVFAGLGGVLLSSRVGAADASTGSEQMFGAYAAAFIGGVAWGGGGGTMLGAALGVVVLGIIGNGLDLLQLASPYQIIVSGTLILLAVAAHKVGRSR